MVRKEKNLSGECSILELKRRKCFNGHIIEKYICNGEYSYQVNILQMNSKKTEAYREMQK